jgi:hypothetical protein
MLNRALLLQELQAVSDKLFLDAGVEYDIARASWQRIIADPLFVHKVKQVKSEWMIPDWQEKLETVYPIQKSFSSYTVLGVDGSQIYPDRHQGTSCFLVNIGTVELHYGSSSSKPVRLASKPTIYTGQLDDPQDQEFALSPDVVNCRRQELEFQAAIQESAEIKKYLEPTRSFLFLFDGSLIFWHLESKETGLKDYFINAYIAQLHQLYEQKTLCAGYISLPKSKELVNLIRIELCNFVLQGCTQLNAVDHIVDTTVCQFFLPEHARSIIFKSNASIGKRYPAHLVPHFFYLNVGHEIGRVEIPAWIAENEAYVQLVSEILLDQSLKGNGYPVALAEAHEQAVIKGPDRDFFYQVISRFSIEQKQRIQLSQKSMKKRGMSI